MLAGRGGWLGGTGAENGSWQAPTHPPRTPPATWHVPAGPPGAPGALTASGAASSGRRKCLKRCAPDTWPAALRPLRSCAEDSAGWNARSTKAGTLSEFFSLRKHSGVAGRSWCAVGGLAGWRARPSTPPCAPPAWAPQPWHPCGLPSPPPRPQRARTPAQRILTLRLTPVGAPHAAPLGLTAHACVAAPPDAPASPPRGTSSSTAPLPEAPQAAIPKTCLIPNQPPPAQRAHERRRGVVRQLREHGGVVRRSLYVESPGDRLLAVVVPCAGYRVGPICGAPVPVRGGAPSQGHLERDVHPGHIRPDLGSSRSATNRKARRRRAPASPSFSSLSGALSLALQVAAGRVQGAPPHRRVCLLPAHC